MCGVAPLTEHTTPPHTTTVIDIASRAHRAAQVMGATPHAVRCAALQRVQRALQQHRASILAANQEDCTRAEAAGVAAPLLKRLRLDPTTLDALAKSIQSIASLPDPLNRTLESRLLDTNLEVHRRTVPIGVIGFVFESRPDALVQIATLALKSGNCAILKGGSEAAATNRLLTEIIATAALEGGALPESWLSLISNRAAVHELLKLHRYIDLVVPRGSNEFVQHIMRHSAIPVLGHADGVCHLYIDKRADIAMAVRLAVDSKTQYVAVCNAAETLLVHTHIAARALPPLIDALQQRGVEVRGCSRSRAIVAHISPATEEDWRCEYLDAVVALRVVESLEHAVAHINSYGSHHTDSIVSSDRARAERFMRRVDSASVMHNASTRFADGYRYGLGAEIGIATGKLHARGPVGLAGLVSYKWYLYGEGHAVADYTGDHRKHLLHRDLPIEDTHPPINGRSQ